MLSLHGNRIRYHQSPVDFRKQANGLMMVVEELDEDPCNGVYIFRNKQADKIKILIWEDNGFWLMYKRMEKGRFQFPEIKEGVMTLSHRQFQWLISGLDIQTYKEPESIKARYFS